MLFPKYSHSIYNLVVNKYRYVTFEVFVNMKLEFVNSEQTPIISDRLNYGYNFSGTKHLYVKLNLTSSVLSKLYVNIYKPEI